MKPKRYFSMAVSNREADIYIFGDIVIPFWQELDKEYGIESETSGYSLANDVKDLDVDVINVYINSYGGHVSEGLTIHNVLASHKAEIRTICSGFACSAASIVFMAGAKRTMYPASLLMIHNASSWAAGNADELRKAADELDVISKTAAAAYRSKITITEDKLNQLLKDEAWITPQDAITMGFATEIREEESSKQPVASARSAVMKHITGAQSSNVRITDISEFMEAVKTQLAGLVTPAPATPPPPAVPGARKLDKYLSALLGRKE